MINIRSYISKDLVFGAIGGSILATIFTSIIDGIETNMVKEKLDISTEQLGILAADLEKMTVLGKRTMDDQDEVIKAQGLRIQELENELEKYDDDEFKKWNQFRSEFSDFLKEKREKEQKEKSEAEVKKAIEEKDWTTVYNKAEGWYNKYPVQMGRYEVFRYLNRDGYVTDEEVNEARNYYGSLWNYVGD